MATRDVEYFKNLHNLTELAVLDEHSLLSALRYRYDSSLIYTNVGEILIALNPFRPLPIYGPSVQLAYKPHQDAEQRRREVPHIYAVARRVYQDMVSFGKDQVCVISGESGAGKTESSKFLIRQVMELSRSAMYGSSSLEAKIIEVNPLLEAFGNAMTTMNDNSSRFGKYLSLLFDKQYGYVVGATVNQYLLEKSRVARQGPGERNFHVFYYMFAGLPESLLSKVNLKKPSQHRYLANEPDCDRFCKSEECQEGFRRLRECMDAVEMSMEHCMEVFQLLAGILLIGDLDFGDNETAFVSPSNVRAVDAAKALGLDAPSLCRALTVSTNITRGEVISISYPPEKAVDCRDAMAKAIYGRLFNFMVSYVNGVLASERPDSVKCSRIGILDIFGFENFEHNSFEQFCINLANEELQNLFNECVFQMEKEELKKEGVRAATIDYQDNSAILQLFLSKPVGMLTLLDEQSQFPKGSDQSFLSKLNEQFAKNQVYGIVKGRSESFMVKHYAGKVTYEVGGFLEKNKDTLAENVLELVKSSSFSLLKTLFLDEALGRATTLIRKREVTLHLNRKNSTRVQGAANSRRGKAYVDNKSSFTSPAALGGGGGRKGGKTTVGGQFRQSLQRLMGKLRNASPHFIRCIKPNRSKRPGDFDQNYVMDQLRYTGVLETVRIRREGFAYRPSFAEFLSIYGNIGHSFNIKIKPVAANCIIVLDKAAITGWQIGKNKVFLKYYHADQLRETLQQQHKHAAAVQKYIRGYLARRECRKLLAVADQQQRQVSDFCRQVALSQRSTIASMMALTEQDMKRQSERQKKLAAEAEAQAKKQAKQAKKDKGKKTKGPARPPQPDWTQSPETSPAKPSLSGTGAAAAPAASSSPGAIYAIPDRAHARPSGAEDFGEDVYGQRPTGVPTTGIAVLPIIPSGKRQLTPSKGSSRLVNGNGNGNGRESPYVVPTSSGGMRYVNPMNGIHNPLLASPPKKPIPAPRDPAREQIKRTPSTVSKLKAAKKNSQSAFSNVYQTPNGYRLRNVKIRQKVADQHPAMQRIHEGHCTSSSSGDDLAEIRTPIIGSPVVTSPGPMAGSRFSLMDLPAHGGASARPFSDSALDDRMKLEKSADWFCGSITRERAEALLKGQRTGTFLLRSSESRFGYACSVSWHERIRHYIVEQLPGGNVRLFGKMGVHDDLQAFVNYYRDEPLSEDGIRLLTPVASKESSVSELETARRYLTGVAGYQGKSGWGRARTAGRNGTLKRKASMTVAKGQKLIAADAKKKKGWRWGKK